MIKSIEKSSVHRITSGQVLVDLQTAVKELVENSLDAGATNIEVKFYDHGIKSFEVIDNGSGISPEDYENVALKHCTSKISSFEDLSTVQSFGFRGEALASLCALSDSVTITTATSKEAPMGTVLEFDRTGRLTSKSGKVARQRGTSVLVKGFFAPLAVRRKELERNSKREFGKALNLLNAYALVPCTKENKGVRLSVVHLQDGGRKSVQMRTDGKPSLKASISSLWGPKQLEALTELSLGLVVVPERSVLRRQAAMAQSSSSTTVSVRGVISKFSPGNGRAGPDRQFLFINGRPCNPTKIQKTFNEVYRSFNTNQSPFIIADFILPTDSCDINVSPDKRTILLHSENALVAALKEALETSFASSRSTFVVQGSSSQRDVTRKPRPESTQVAVDRVVERNGDDVIEVEDNKPEESPKTTSSPISAEIVSSFPRASPGASKAIVEERGGIPDEQTSQVLQTSSSSSGFHSPVSDSPRSAAASSTSTLMSRAASSSTTASTTKKAPTKPVQMVLSTANASWAIRPANEDSALKKRKVERKSGATVLRTRLASFAAPGSQAVASGPPGEDSVESDENVDELDESELSETNSSKPPEDDERRFGDGSINLLNEREDSSDLDDEVGKENRVLPSTEDLTGDDMPLFLPDTVATRKSAENPSEDADVQIKSDNDGDILMMVEDECSALDEERPDHIRSLDQTSSSVNVVLESESSHSGKVVRTEVLKTAMEGADMTVQINIAKVEEVWNALSNKTNIPSPTQDRSSVEEEKEKVEASAGVSNTTDEVGAEQALSRLLDKKDFVTMEILGQFNLGFIIARLREQKHELHHGEQTSSDFLPSRKGASLDDLFIVDQHASDEKYNFETLQQTTKIASQRLFKPQSLELTAADELVAVENIDVLKANGFEVEVDEEASPSQGRVKLVAQPISGNTTFDMKDLEELLHLLSDRPAGTDMVRCSKARAMFAMRACRKSVMIGTALNKSQMTSIVRHMGTMDQPWNCPHGRPTMRHLVSLVTAVGSEKTSIHDIDWSNL